MQHKINLPANLTGLSDAEVLLSQKVNGLNQQQSSDRITTWSILVDLLKEPMLILLIIVTVIYFLLNQYDEAYFMLGAILIVTGISFYQDNRSRKALESLQALNTPVTHVIRNSVPITINSTDIVPGDLVIIEEGGLINADGVVVYSHDFSVNESSLTGEASSIFKNGSIGNDKLYSGTIASSGLAIFKVEQTGVNTKLGRIGKSLMEIKDESSPLQLQIRSFVRKMTFIGILVFLMVWLISFLKNHDWLEGLLKGLTLAMSILPEEIPVAFATFIALGSRRLVRDGILVKKTRVVETLGGATIICTDKTGTITENRMGLQCIYAHRNKQLSNDISNLDNPAKEVIETSMWSSEPIPFDPMEKTIHEVYEKNTQKDKRTEYTMIHEYPLGGKPPMMTHVFENVQKEQIIACKGAPEAILEVCTLQDEEKLMIRNIIVHLAGKGYRLLGVALCSEKLNEFPATQQEIRFQFMGLIAFYDPPKKNIREVFNSFYAAGVNVKIITGDNALTTRAIAESAGLRDALNVVDGDELMKMSESQLSDCVRNTNIFTRMFPEAKLAVINAIKANHQIVAMVGDGVNDGPALKAADIGIAMGHKGTELAKNAADLILLEDDLAKMVVAIAAGRRIYSNLKKAVQYIISIHIPIIATVSLPLFLGWIYPNIFTPVHVIFLELVMGPTCSIVFENEPLEKNAMQRPPRLWTSSFLNWKEMTISIFQGIMISIGVLLIYQYAVHSGADEDMTRTMVFITLVMANIFLTLVNRSFYYSILSNLKNKNPLLFAVISVTIIMLIAMVYVPAFRIFFHLAVPPIPDILICITTAIISVLWIEIWKWNKRKTK